MTRHRKNSRDLTHWIVMLAVGTAVYLIGCHFAHAAVGAADPVPASQPIDWYGIALATAAFGSLVLHAIAARYHSAKIEAIAKDVDEVRALGPVIKPTLTVARAPGSNAAPMLAVLLLGALAAPALTGCSTQAGQQLKSEGSASVTATLDCAKKLGPGQLEAGLVMLATDIGTMLLAHQAIDWNALATAAIADVSEIKACALAEYHAVTAKQGTPAAAAALVSVNAPPVDPLAAAVARIKAARKVTAIMVPSGAE